MSFGSDLLSCLPVLGAHLSRVQLATQHLFDDEECALRVKAVQFRGLKNCDRDRFTFSLEGTEYSCNKSWTGSKNTLEAKCAEIVRAAVELVPLQAERHRQRLVQEAESQRRAAMAADQHRRAQARAEQVKHAVAIMEANEQRERLLAFLEQLQLRGKEFAPPYDDRVATWIEVVRSQLNARDPVAEMLHECLSVPSWATWPPPWWPEQAPQPADADQDEAH